jgi:trimethylamine--corrinoid protein Co-methyltransferase
MKGGDFMIKPPNDSLNGVGMGIRLLTESDLYTIHCATIEILENTGIRVPSKEAQDIFESGGCIVDRETKNVKIPKNVVEDAILSAPETVELCGRDPKKNYLAGPHVGYTNFGEGLRLIDPYTREEHVTGRKDLVQITRVCDAIDELSVYERACGCNDVPGQVQTIHNAEKILANTTKHSFIGSGNGYNCRKMLELAYEAAGGEDNFRKNPIYSATICPNSPLMLNPEVTEVIIESARGGAPALILSMTMSGATAPITLAGSLVVHNCEVLGGMVLQQLTVKGSKCIYGTSSLGFDLKYTTSPVGTPELALMSAGVASLAKYYKLPCFVAGG